MPETCAKDQQPNERQTGLGMETKDAERITTRSTPELVYCAASDLTPLLHNSDHRDTP